LVQSTPFKQAIITETLATVYASRAVESQQITPVPVQMKQIERWRGVGCRNSPAEAKNCEESTD
jgi:hypothetical protein